MKTLLVLLACCCAVPSDLRSQITDNPREGFERSRWGMKVQQVLSLLPSPDSLIRRHDPEKDLKYFTLSGPDTIFGVPVRGMYSFSRSDSGLSYLMFVTFSLNLPGRTGPQNAKQLWERPQDRYGKVQTQDGPKGTLQRTWEMPLSTVVALRVEGMSEVTTLYYYPSKAVRETARGLLKK